MTKKKWEVKISIDGWSILWFIVIVVSLVLFGSGVYLVWIMSDSFSDRRYCDVGMSLVEANILHCYANDDFWEINRGRDIDCTCFYFDKYWDFQQKEFSIT